MKVTKNKLKIQGNGGITLLALVITLIILLVLAGVSVSMLVGENGIFESAVKSKNLTEQGAEKEQIALAIMTEQTDNLGRGTSMEGLQKAFNTNGVNATVATEGEGYRVVFNNSLREYVISSKGVVKSVYDPKQENLPETETVDEWTKLNKVSKLGGFDSSKGVNAPKLGSELTAVTLTSDISAYQADGTWYDYVAQTTTTENGGTSKWANAVTTDSDGNITGYYVWIPRYAYKIISGYHQSGADINSSAATTSAGTIEIKFLKNATNEPADGSEDTILTDPSKVTYTGNTQDQWLVHPAFLSDANVGGGFGSKSGNSDGVTGIWVAKFEASAFVDGSDTTTRNLGSIAAEQKIRIASLPEVEAAVNINIGRMYDLAISANSNAESHMLKNSEWGVTSYLAQSSYGRNGTEVSINSQNFSGEGGQSNPFTGGSNGNNAYIDSTHVKQSTTGNAYGIYDMSGGKWEYVASYVNNGNSYLSTYGGNMTSAVSQSTKYKTVYKSTSSTGEWSSAIQSADYELNKLIKGDAVYETSSNYLNTNSWFADYSYFPYSNNPFFTRGGSCGVALVLACSISTTTLATVILTRGFAYCIYKIKATILLQIVIKC